MGGKFRLCKTHQKGHARLTLTYIGLTVRPGGDVWAVGYARSMADGHTRWWVLSFSSFSTTDSHI